MKKQLATLSLVSSVVFLSACSSTGHHTETSPKTTSGWQTCATAGGLAMGIPAALSSLATGGAAAAVGALVAGIGCAVSEQNTDVLFEFGAHELDMRDRLIIDKVISEMGKKGHVSVVGYTCTIGSEKVNQRLSEQRANAVKEYLMSKGIDESRITSEGKGENDPVASNSTEETRKLNRRVEMTVTH